MVWWTPREGPHKFHIFRHYVLSCTLCFVCACRPGRAHWCDGCNHEKRKKLNPLGTISIIDLNLVSSP